MAVLEFPPDISKEVNYATMWVKGHFPNTVSRPRQDILVLDSFF